jgi:hypothetical protein
MHPFGTRRQRPCQRSGCRAHRCFAWFRDRQVKPDLRIQKIVFNRARLERTTSAASSAPRVRELPALTEQSRRSDPTAVDVKHAANAERIFAAFSRHRRESISSANEARACARQTTKPHLNVSRWNTGWKLTLAFRRPSDNTVLAGSN